MDLWGWQWDDIEVLMKQGKAGWGVCDVCGGSGVDRGLTSDE